MSQVLPLVSVVTPFYNTAAYLEECIQSVLAQSYDNFEYVLVNNCSTDGSGEIAARYASADRRIRLLDNAGFLSQLDNYNHALRQISLASKYCKVVQADDWIAPHCITRMVEVAERYPTVGIVASYYYRGPQLKGAGLPYPATKFSGREVCRQQLTEGAYYFGSPTTVLYRSDIVRNRQAFYPTDGFDFEDTDVCYELCTEWDFGFVHDILSFLRIDATSITGRAMSFNPWLLGKLLLVRRYGPRYLDQDEYRKCLRAISRRYSQYLGESVLMRRGAAFWEYHARGLATVGQRLTIPSLALHTARAVVQLALNPLETGKRLRQRRLHGQSSL